jgi:hypothetical protein
MYAGSSNPNAEALGQAELAIACGGRELTRTHRKHPKTMWRWRGAFGGYQTLQDLARTIG